MQRLAQLKCKLQELFPERRLYLRSGGGMTSFVLSTRRQLAIAAGVAGAALWMGVCTAAMLVDLLSVSSGDRAIVRLKAESERYVADRQARLDSAMARLNASGATAEVADAMERRHAALALLLTNLRGQPGAVQALEPAITRALSPASLSADERIERIRVGQDQLLDATDSFAKSRAERLRLAFRMAGLTPSSYVDRGEAIGGPLIEAKDPQALAAVLDVNDDFATRIQAAARDLSDADALAQAAQDLPLARPTHTTGESSGFGARTDPFTGRVAYHPGLDFPSPYATPVYATGPGVVSYTGWRSGYGNVVEIDHGHGLKTRYAHLSAIAVRAGQPVGVGQRIAAVGSTGRSTGPHLHYEVWVDGRAENPGRFLKAGRYIFQDE